MHDIKFIRQNPDAFDAGLARRGLEPISGFLLELDEAERSRKTVLQQLQAEQNKLAKMIGAAKAKGESPQEFFEKSKEIKEKISELEIEVALSETGQSILHKELIELPNIPADDVPQGKDESGNKEIRKVGEKPNVTNPKEHFEIGEALGLMDFDAAAKISGSRFVVLKGGLARLERALASFMLDIHTQEFGYTEIVPPYLVKENAAFGTGQLPKFKTDLFLALKYNDPTLFDANKSIEPAKTLDEAIDKLNKINASLQNLDKYYLIPTSEVPLTNLVNDSILKEDELPLRFTAYSPCFRSEAGAAGKDTRGMIRQHQFSKVELVSITHPLQSNNEHERMTECAETILKRLGLHYRTMLLCTGDMGFSAQKTYDIEVWLPGQNAYREISSCSNCGAFQARRMKARFKADDKKETEFVHTLNGSGLAIGRTMIAILENYQQPDGSVAIPEKLQPYMGEERFITGI